MNRTNSFLSSLKWWPSLQSNSSDTNTEARGEARSRAGPIGAGGLKNIHTFGSSVAVQKLRESKWFKSDEERIFCAVIESGFIVEIRQQSVRANCHVHATHNASDKSCCHSCNSLRNSSAEVTSENDLKCLNNNCNASEDDDQSDDNNDENHLQNENATTSWFGVVLCKTKGMNVAW